jgi:hypothetical protein
VDLGEGFGEVVGWGFGGGQGLAAGLDCDGAVAPSGANDFLYAPPGLGLDPVADREGCKHNRQVPRRLKGDLGLASEIIPASATTVTSVRWWAALNALITGSMVAVSALLPSNAATFNGKPDASVSNPRVICGSRRRS